MAAVASSETPDAFALGTPITLPGGESGVVRLGEEESGLVLAQLRDGTSTWAFAADCRRRHVAATAAAAAAAPAGHAPPAAPSRKAQPRPKAALAGASSASSAPRLAEPEAAPGLSVGTLRWAPDHRWPQLGAPVWKAPPQMLGSGWHAYIEARLGHRADASGRIKIDGSLIDGLSYPLSLVHALRLLGARAPQHVPALAGARLRVVVAGASVKVEERLLRETDYWLELAHLLPEVAHVELILVGPEVSAAGAAAGVRELGARVSARCHRGRLGDVLASCSPADTVVFGCNTGCGSGIGELMWSWTPELLRIAAEGFLAVFTCANDYSDLRGEVNLLKLLKCRTVLPPLKNPFEAATVVKEPGETRDEDGDLRVEWSRSSAYVYAVRGLEHVAAARVAASDPAKLEQAVLALAAKLRQTQVVSKVP